MNPAPTRALVLKMASTPPERLWALVLTLLSGLSCAGSEPREERDKPPTVEIGPTVPAVAREDKPAPRPPKPGDLAFLDWAASHCYVDELGPSRYATDWLRYRADRGAFGPDAVLPATPGTRLPKPGSAAAHERAAALRAAWRAKPESHVLDCRFIVPVRRCAGCRGARLFVAHYVAYLPAAIVTDPDRIGALLMLLPGGRGGRTRPFLSPVPDKTVFQRGSGGLETRQIVDAHLAAHPELLPPIVVALQTAGAEYNNGSIEHLTHDLPAHIADTYLDRDASTLALGIEGISSGARAILEALYEKPDAFTSVGFTCLACGRIASERRIGSPPIIVRRFPNKAISRAEIATWTKKLARRTAAGELSIRFSIGSRDGQLACSRKLHDLFLETGVVKRSAERVLACHGPEGGPPCDRAESGFVLYENEMHHYGILEKCHGEQIRWHLDALSQAVHTRRAR